MVSPELLAGMVQRGELLGDGVDRRDADIFPVVAPLASESQVIEGGTTAFGEGCDVLDRKGIGGVPFLRLAILAAIAGPFGDGKPLGGSDPRFSHGRA